MSVRLNVRLDASQMIGDTRQFAIQLDGGPQTTPFAIGEGQTSEEARHAAITHLQMMLELLQKGQANDSGWFGTVADGCSMAPVNVKW